MANLLERSTRHQSDTYTSTGGLIRLIARDGQFVAAIVVHVPWPWVLRRPYLSANDVD